VQIVKATLIVLATIVVVIVLWPLLLLLFVGVVADAIKIAGLALLGCFVFALLMVSITKSREEARRAGAHERLAALREKLAMTNTRENDEAYEAGFLDAQSYKAAGGDLPVALRDKLARSNGFDSWADFASHQPGYIREAIE
jgi:hypothetical protein